MAPINNKIYYEQLSNGELMIVPIVRSLKEVILERSIIAEYFSTGPYAHVLSGICDIPKTEISLGPLNEKIKIPISLDLQNQIDVYNNVTADQVLRKYRKDQEDKIEQEWSDSSMDRTNPS